MGRSPATWQELLANHMAAEGRMDLDAAIATVADAVVYEFPLQGRRFTGRENARRFYADGAELRYRRAVASGRADLPEAAVRARWEAGGAVIVEASAYPLLLEDGSAEVHPVGAVLVAGPAGVTHERIYANDRMFGLLTAHVSGILEDM